MAERTDIIEQIETLALHCRPPLMSIEQRTLWLASWCDDLAEFPLAAIQAGCRAWRQGDSAKFPTPGLLLPLVRKAAEPERRIGPAEPTPQAWRPLSDEEYEKFSLTDKVRHHLAMANHCAMNAGPMWRHGRPCAVDDLPDPDAWRAWRTRSAHHAAEAERLRHALNGYREAAE